MHQTKLSLLIFTTILATCLPTYAQQQPVDLIGAGTTILPSLLVTTATTVRNGS